MRAAGSAAGSSSSGAAAQAALSAEAVRPAFLSAGGLYSRTVRPYMYSCRYPPVMYELAHVSYPAVLESYPYRGYDRSNRRLPAAPPSREGRQQQQPQPAAGSRSGREHAPPVAS